MSRSPKRTVADPVPARRNLPAESRTLIAHAGNDITIPYFSGALQPVDDTLIQRGGGKGLKIYDEIERDTHAFSMLQKRKRVLLAREWEVTPASDAARDAEAAEFVREVLEALPFDRICGDMLDATLKGFAISEIVWKREGDRILPDLIMAHDQRRFVFDRDWKPRLLTWANMREGIELPDRKFVVHRVGVKGNNPYGLGLGSILFWPVLFKREGIAFWLHFLEKYAGPTIIGTTPYGTVTEEQRRFLEILASVRTSAAVAVPVGSDVKFLEAARSGSVTYQEFLEYWDTQISIATVGETLTTQVGDSGSRALGDVHAEILGLLVDSDGDLLSGSLRDQLITWLVEYNVPGAGIPHVWRLRPENQKAVAETGKAQADAAIARDKALRAVLATIALIEDETAARDLLTATGLVETYDEATVEVLVTGRAAFGSAPVPGDGDDEDGDPDERGGPAFAIRLKKKRRTSASLSRAVSSRH